MNLGEQDYKVSKEDNIMDKNQLDSFFGGCDDKNGGVNCDDMYSGGFEPFHIHGGWIIVLVIFLIFFLGALGSYTGQTALFGLLSSAAIVGGVAFYVLNKSELRKQKQRNLTLVSVPQNPPPMPPRNESPYERVESEQVGGNYW
jgi:hypothetical protein